MIMSPEKNHILMLVQYFQQGIRITGIAAAKIMDGAMGSDKNRLGSLDLL